MTTIPEITETVSLDDFMRETHVMLRKRCPCLVVYKGKITEKDLNEFVKKINGYAWFDISFKNVYGDVYCIEEHEQADDHDLESCHTPNCSEHGDPMMNAFEKLLEEEDRRHGIKK